MPPHLLLVAPGSAVFAPPRPRGLVQPNLVSADLAQTGHDRSQASIRRSPAEVQPRLIPVAIEEQRVAQTADLVREVCEEQEGEQSERGQEPIACVASPRRQV